MNMEKSDKISLTWSISSILPGDTWHLLDCTTDTSISMKRREKKLNTTSTQRRNRWKCEAICDPSNHDLDSRNLRNLFEQSWSGQSERSEQSGQPWAGFSSLSDFSLLPTKVSDSYFVSKYFDFHPILIFICFWFFDFRPLLMLIFIRFWLHSIGLWLLLMAIFTFNLAGLQISFQEIVNLRICQKCSTREFVTEFPLFKQMSESPAVLLLARPTNMFFHENQILFPLWTIVCFSASLLTSSSSLTMLGMSLAEFHMWFAFLPLSCPLSSSHVPADPPTPPHPLSANTGMKEGAQLTRDSHGH